MKIRYCRSSGEIELEGSEDQVRQWWEELYPLLSSTKVAIDQRNPVLSSESKAADANPAMPFGEFLQQFKDDINDVDRMLIAGAYVQSGSADKVFTTGGAHEVLVKQGRKLSNPSVSVSRLIDARKAFRVSGSELRVSEVGMKYLATLKGGQ